MSKRESVQRQQLIIRKLQKAPAPFAEIQDYLARQSEQQGYRFTCSIRTFKRDCEEIESIYGHRISFHFPRGLWVLECGDLDGESERLLEAFEMFQALRLSDGLSKHIYFEPRKPQGTEHFYVLLHAIKGRQIVRFRYEKFQDEAATVREAQPHALKEFRSRWYLIAVDEKDGRVKTFGLDRMRDLELLRRGFRRVNAVDPPSQFRDAFGIINPAGEAPRDVILCFEPLQGAYVKTFPLHHSQQVVSESDEATTIGLRVRLTHDFIMELLSFGDQVRIKSPARLVNMVRNAHRHAFEQYGTV